VNKAESQAMLNNLTDVAFQDTFQNMIEALGMVNKYRRKLYLG
jgi:hypothetical protein